MREAFGVMRIANSGNKKDSLSWESFLFYCERVCLKFIELWFTLKIVK